MTKTFWKLLGGATALTVLGLTPCVQAQQGPIKIGASMSLTGTYAKPGSYQKDGYEICADEVNAKAEFSDARSSSCSTTINRCPPPPSSSTRS